MAHPGRSVQFGIGLIDTLVALTLLALSLLGASATLIRTLGANRAAALQTTAVDLAADLGEDRGAGTVYDEAELIEGWQRRVTENLPVGAPPLDQEVTGPDVRLRWWDPSVHRPAEFSMQLANAWPGAAP